MHPRPTDDGKKTPKAPRTDRRDPGIDLLRACVGNHGACDELAWQRLYEYFGPKIHSRLVRAAGHHAVPLTEAEAQELTQDLFLRFFTCTRPFLGETRGEVWAYINRSVENLVTDMARRIRTKRRRGFSGNVEIRSSGAFRFHSRFGVLATREQDPEHRLLAEESKRELDRRWTQKYGGKDSPRAAALRLTLLEGWSSKEASRRLEGSLTPKQIDNTVGSWRRDLAKRGEKVAHRERGPRTRTFDRVLAPIRSIPVRAQDVDDLYDGFPIPR